MGLERLKILAAAARRLEELAAQASKRPISRVVSVLRSKIAQESEAAVADLMQTPQWTPPKTESRVLDALMKKPGGSNDLAKLRLESRLRRELFNTGRRGDFQFAQQSRRGASGLDDAVREATGGAQAASPEELAIIKDVSRNEPAEGIAGLMQKEPWVDAITGEVRSDLPPTNVLKAMLAEDNAKRFAGEIPNPRIPGEDTPRIDPLRQFYKEQAQEAKSKGLTMKAGFFKGLDRQEDFYEKSVGVGRELREAKASGVGGANRNRMSLLRDRTISGDLSRLDNAVRDSLTFESDAGPGWVRDSVMETLHRMGGGDKQSKLAGVSLARLHQEAPLVAQFLIREAKAVMGSTTYAKQGSAAELNAAVQWVKQALREDPENIPVGDLVRVLRSAAYRRGSGQTAVEGLQRLRAIRAGDKRPIISEF